MSNWTNTTIGSQVTLQRGIDITRKEQRDGAVPVVSSGGVKSFHDTSHRPGPGVVLGRKGTLGTVFFLSGPYWPHDTTLWVKDFKGNYPRYVYYFFKNLDVLHLDVGSANPTLNRNHVHPIDIVWPPLPEQRHIAAVLGALDDKIELNRKMNQGLEAMAQALFKSWFVDFDPAIDNALRAGNPIPDDLQAKATRRSKVMARGSHEIPPYANLFPDSFEDSELGSIPAEWKAEPFSEVIELLSGGTPKRAIVEYWGGNVPWYSVRDAPPAGDIFVTSTSETVTELGIEKSAAKVVPPWTSVISARGTVGKIALTSRPMAFNQSCYGVRSSSGHGEIFTHFALKRLVGSLKSSAHGSVFDTITKTTFAAIISIVPTTGIAGKFDEQIRPLLEQVLLNGQQSEVLVALRDTLLPKLISGEVRVPASAVPGVTE